MILLNIVSQIVCSCKIRDIYLLDKNKSKCPAAHLERPPFLWSLIGVAVISNTSPSRMGEVRSLATFTLVVFSGSVVAQRLRLM